MLEQTHSTVLEVLEYLGTLARNQANPEDACEGLEGLRSRHPQSGVELLNSVGGCFRRMEKRDDAITHQCVLYFGKAKGHQTGFAGYRQAIKYGVFEQILGAAGKIGGNPHLPPKGARKGVGFNCLVQRFLRCCHPHAAARQSALEVGNCFAIGGDHEADHFLDRPRRSRGDAKSLYCARLRSMIELDAVLLCEHEGNSTAFI